MCVAWDFVTEQRERVVLASLESGQLRGSDITQVGRDGNQYDSGDTGESDESEMAVWQMFQCRCGLWPDITQYQEMPLYVQGRVTQLMLMLQMFCTGDWRPPHSTGQSDYKQAVS